jgi:hypothetical protein
MPSASIEWRPKQFLSLLENEGKGSNRFNFDSQAAQGFASDRVGALVLMLRHRDELRSTEIRCVVAA